MITSTTDNLEGYRIIEYLGVVTSYDWDTDECANLKALGYIIKKAEELGADALIGVTISGCSTFACDDDGNKYADMVATGTAVRIEKR